jgi:hypothetical protein
VHKRYYTRYFGCEETAGPSIVSHALRETYHSSHCRRLFFRVADPDPGSGMGKKSGSGMNNPDHISESLTIFGVKIHKFFDADPRSGINIPDPRHCFFLFVVWQVHSRGGWLSWLLALVLQSGRQLSRFKFKYTS